MANILYGADVAKSINERTIEIERKAFRLLRGLKRSRAVDLLVGHQSTFNERSNLNTLEGKIKREGKLLYEQLSTC